jgi:hypothetical protein
MWWCAAGWAQEPETVEQVLARFVDEPSIGVVQAWAAEEVLASPTRVRRWLAQTRTAALLPDLSVDWRVRDDWDAGFGYYGPNGLEPAPGLDLSVVPEDSGRSWTRELQIGLDWDLSDVVSSSDRIRMISEAQELAELRERVVDEVTRLYFERRRLQVEAVLAPALDPGSYARDLLRMQELTASLDAATGGAFSRALASRRPPG